MFRNAVVVDIFVVVESILFLEIIFVIVETTFGINFVVYGNFIVFVGINFVVYGIIIVFVETGFFVVV